MNGRIKLKPRKYKKEKKDIKDIIVRKFLIILTLVVFCAFLLLSFFSKKATPILLEHASHEANKLAIIIIHKAISKQIENEADLNELVITDKNTEGEIQGVDFNPYIINKILNSITNAVQLNLKWLQEGKIDLIDLSIEHYNSDKLKQGIIYEIPMGIISQNAFLTNIGPKIPVKLNLVGSVETGVSTKVSEYGINNAIIEISVSVKVTENVILPFISKQIEIETAIPVALKIIEGKVPEYYSGSLNKDSDKFSIPLQ